MKKDKKRYSLATKSIIGILLGVILGVILLNIPNNTFRDQFLLNGILKLIAEGYLTFIKVTIVPFVFASLVMGISSASDVRQVGRVGSRIVGLYVVTTTIAAIIGILGGLIFKPGVGFDMGTIELVATEGAEISFVDSILQMIPSNIISSMANGEMIHIVIFALFFGIAISLVGEKADNIKKSIESLNHIMLKIVNIVMEITPIGVFALMTRTVANLGYDIILALGKYATVQIFLYFIFAVIVYMPMLKLLTKVNVKNFMKRFLKLAPIPFSTASSNATIPYSIQFLKENGVSEKIASFTIPLGATINMDGSTIMQALTAIFVAQLYDIDMTLQMMLIIIITTTLASIGSPGMPGVVMVSLITVLQSLGFPLEAIAMIVGVDRFTDMFKTVLNIMGDSVCSMIVAKTENELDLDIYYNMGSKLGGNKNYS